MQSKLFFCLSTVVAVLIFAGPALAQDDAGEPDIKEQAKEAFAQASELFANGEFVDAAAAFRRAMALAPSWKLYYNIGHSEAAARHYGLALEAFQMYLAEAGDAIPDDREEEVFAQIAELKKKVGSVKVTAPSGAIIIIDNIQRGVAPMVGSMKVAAGKTHKVLVKQEGEVILEQTVRIWADEEATLTARAKGDSGEQAKVAVTVNKDDAAPEEKAATADVEKAPAARESVTPVDPNTVKVDLEISTKDDKKVVQTIEQKHPLRLTGAVLIGLGTLGLAAGTTFGVIATVKTNNMDCPGNVCRTTDSQNDLDFARKSAKVATIALPVGGSVTAVGIALLITGRVLERKKLNAPAAMSVQPVVAPGYSGLVLGGRF
jgi:hypothetical protein